MTKDTESDAFAAMARSSLAAYMTIVHTDSDMPDVADGSLAPQAHHMQMIRALEDDSLGDTLILAPRGSAKTTLVQNWIEWKIGQASLGSKDWANQLRVIYCSATAAQAYKVSNAVRETLEFNRTYQQIFPKVKPHKTKWSESEWKVKGNTVKDATFLAAGRKGSVLGARGDYIILDDIVDGEVAKSPTEQEATLFWLDNTIDKVRVPGGRFIQCATRWYESDPPNWAMEQGWHQVYIKALTECEGTCSDALVMTTEMDGTTGDAQITAPSPHSHSFWPERFSVASLEAQQLAKPLSFALQMQNEITPYGGLMFKREWFENRFEYVPDPSNIHGIYASWDTAGTLTGRSYTVGAVIAVTKGWDYYLLQLVRGKMEYADVRKAIKDTATRFKVSTTFIEDRSTGQSAVQELRKDPNFYGGIVAVPPFGQRGGPPSRSELLFIESVTPPFQDRRFLIPDSAYFERHNMEDWRDEFFKEMLGYPDHLPDDIVVAITQLVYLFEKEKYRFEANERAGQRMLGYGMPTERAVAI